jgi:holin-like protein
MLGLGLILGASTAGRLVSKTFDLPIGGAPLGLILLTAVLLRWPALHRLVKLPAAALTASLGLLFVPFVVDVRFRWNIVADHWLAIACAIAVSSVVGLTVTATLVDRLEPSAPQAEADQ